jgi:hypothetical protein
VMVTQLKGKLSNDKSFEAIQYAIALSCVIW